MKNSLQLHHKLVDLRRKIQFIQHNHGLLTQDGLSTDDIFALVKDLHNEMAETRYLIKRQEKLTQLT